MNKIKILKFLDNTIGKQAVSLCRLFRHKKAIPEKLSKFLIIRPGGIGDAVLLLPAIDVIKYKFPDAIIDVLCEKRNHGIFLMKKTINTIYLYDRGVDILRCLRNEYDVVIDTEQWHRLSAVVAYLTGAPMRIGFSTNERKGLFTHTVPYSHDEHEVRSFLNLLKPLMGDTSGIKPEPPFMDIPEEFPGHLLPITLKGDDKIVSICPGATVRERRWGGDKFGAVARNIDDKGYKVLILGGEGDRGDAKKIMAQAEDCIDLTGRTTLSDVAFLLRLSRLFIGADSGILHIAYAVGTPTVSLFGSGIEKKWAPPGEKHIVLNKHLSCSPCTRFGYTPECKRDVECLKNISVDDVIRAAWIILDSSGL